MDGFELAQLAVQALVPITLAGIGYVIQRGLKATDQNQWGSRIVIEKRIKIFEDSSHDLNKLLCFAIVSGEWDKLTVDDLRQTKLRLDRLIHSNRFILGDELVDRYKRFIHSVFDELTPIGEPARFVRPTTDKDPDFQHPKLSDPAWFLTFSSDQKKPIEEIKKSYLDLGQAFGKSFKIVDLDKPVESRKNKTTPERTSFLAYLSPRLDGRHQGQRPKPAPSLSPHRG
jgi:hypothetical protein